MSYPSLREFLFALLLFITVLALVFASRYNRLYSPQTLDTEQSVVLHIHERIGLDQLHAKFDSLGVEIDREELLWAGSILGWRNFRPGRYEIGYELSYDTFLSNLARGIQDPGNVIVHSGIDIPIFSQRLSRQLFADSASIAAQFADTSDIALELGLTGEELFARMLPNTYQMYWTSNPENVVRRIYREFSQRIENQLDQQIAESDFDLNEIVIMASIVEWEARHSDEKPKISGLYINRLNRNMLLQADPTVLYALGERRRILFEDYRFDHPYNTYIHAGLPPGPITNPDEASIRAVLNPEEHDYLFMVATPEGTHEFNRTFEEHRTSSERWRRWIREQYRIAREREEAENAGQ
ncbi:endolytic transglycosylase MltG [Rhodohalobacter sp. SW132]|uniref:endolytic transglycosylase MltG n=1 Tax=Rhodohalobacter sp. SW132 TaxID=2293433 RepID=UPI000E22EF96|nr:endolytic transglycosylase MltG [Rhodohalobacter sp. SW132]REL37593.1 endolytic transglycosylase MltG [Rhodohalobacter sp. SW132]